MSYQLVLKCTGVTLTFSENEMQTLMFRIQMSVKNILSLYVMFYYGMMMYDANFTCWL